MEGEIARGGGVDGVNVQQCLTCLTGSWPSPCLSACLLPHRWDRIHLMSNYITSAPRCHRCALSSASVCVCVHISYTLSSPRARRITAFEFAFPCTTCSSVLYFTVFKIESAGGKHKTQTKARRLIRERWKPPPPPVLLCSADAPREGETARKERRADVFGSSQGQPVLMMAAWRLCCANKKSAALFSLADRRWVTSRFLSFSPCLFLWLQFILIHVQESLQQKLSSPDEILVRSQFRVWPVNKKRRGQVAIHRRRRRRLHSAQFCRSSCLHSDSIMNDVLSALVPWTLYYFISQEQMRKQTLNSPRKGFRLGSFTSITGPYRKTTVTGVGFCFSYYFLGIFPVFPQFFLPCGWPD